MCPFNLRFYIAFRGNVTLSEESIIIWASALERGELRSGG
jgi:hypothetical protein